jgi:phage host-nuclease inhibitor protein Gam
MPSKRIKIESFASRHEFEAALDQVALCTAELRSSEAELDLQIQSVKQNFAPTLAAYQAKIVSLAARCEKYATEHRAELLPDEKKAKSLETPLCRWGFRTGMPALKLLSKMSWEKVILQIKKLHGWQFLRQTFEVDKQALLTAQTTAPLSDYGVKVVQEESFFIEPKIESETVKTEVACPS